MQETQVDNRRIVKNSLFLYVRMIVIMCVNLYVVRLILDILGVVDYGINNVVAGVVSMFSFLNGTLATSTQRYFSIALVEGNIQKLKKLFNLNISVFLIFIGIVIIIAETLGLWYVNNKMIIPDNRIIAANIIYQLSIVGFAINLLIVPFNALIIAHENMKLFAYIGIIEALFKFVIVGALFLSGDKLIIYGIMSLLSTLLVFSCYYFYCRKHYVECKYIPYWNTTEAKDIASFSGWHLLGTISVVVNSQGVNLLINSFFNPAVNGARAIAMQLNQALNQLSQNFFVAVKPQMYKAYANKEDKTLLDLIFNSTTICVFLVSIIAVPFIVNANFILSLWLKEVPLYTVIFTQLIMINSIVDSTSNPSICAVLATKKIKVFYWVTGSLLILNLPISYVLLSLGYDATSTMIVSIAISYLAILVRAFFLHSLVHLSLIRYFCLISKLSLVTILIWYITFLSKGFFLNDTWQSLIISVCISTLSHSIIYLLIIPKNYRRDIFNYILKRVAR